MKVLFSISGIGFGHTIREEAIINELKKRDKTIEILVLGYRNSYNYFKNKFKTYRSIGHNFSGKRCKTSSFTMIMENFLYFFIFFIDFFNAFFKILYLKPKIVVVDADPVVVLAAKCLRRKVVYVYNYDLNKADFIKKKISAQRGLFWFVLNLVYKISNKVIIPVLTQDEQNGKINYINPIIREFSKKSEKQLMKELNLKKKPILVSIGGSDFGLELVNAILEVAEEFKEDFIVFGLKQENKENVKFYQFKDNLLDYLKVSKGIICMSGHNTLSEALFFKKAALVFYIKNYAEHEQNMYLAKEHIMKVETCNDFKEILRNYLKSINILESKVKRLNLKGDGAKKAVDIILSLK